MSVFPNSLISQYPNSPISNTKIMIYHQTLNKIIATVPAQIKAIDKATMNFKPKPAKWSKKELLGHLVDSAYNNHQRFLRAEQQGNLIFQGYDPDEWVIKNNYQNRETDEILNLWILSNQHLSALVENLPKSILQKETTAHNFHKICMNLLKEGESTSLSYLMEDYIFHLEYHLNQLITDYKYVQ